MSSIPRVSHSSESRTSNPVTGVEDKDVQLFRNFIQESKSLGCSPEDTSAASAREVVSESFVDSLTKDEIDEFRKKLFSYWEKSAKTAEKPKIEDDSSKMVLHQGSDLKIQSEEAVTSFEDAKSEEPPNTGSLHDIGKLIEIELRNIRETKLSESCVGKTVAGKMRRSENIDFTELKRKAAGLPVVTDLKSTPQKRQLPVLRRTDPLEMVLRIYECIDPDPAGNLLFKDAGEATEGSLSPKVSEDHEFRRHLVIEMRIMYGRLVGAPKEPTHPIIEEYEGESSLSSAYTRESTFSSRDPSLISSPLGPSLTVYPEETPGSPRTPQGDDTLASISESIESSSKCGQVKKGRFSMPEGAKIQSSVESGNSTSTSTARFSDDTLSDISSLPTDTSGARTSVSSLQDAESLEESLPRVPQLQIDDATDDDAFLPLPTGDAGTSYLTVPQAPGLPSSLEDSSENAEAEDVGNERRRRERSPKEDENKKQSKRRAI